MTKKIVIIGGGFAGVNLAEKLANKEGIHVTLVDKNNYNFFPPLLYQVATGFIEVSNITYPFRKLFAGKKNISFRMGSLEKIIPEDKRIILDNGQLQYDELVIATGTESNYFGIENIRKNGIPMKTIDDAVNLRNTILLKAELATRIEDPEERAKLTTIVIAGGGPTGVELAGMLSEIKKNVLSKEYPELASQQVTIYLVDAIDVVLGPMSKKSQQYTHDTLVKMGVKVMLGKQVKDYVDDTVFFADGTTIPTKLLIWTAGVAAKTFEGLPEESYGRGKRLLVNEFNQVTGLQNIYAIGDTCLQTTDKKFDKGHPQLAQVAIQQGKKLAKNFIALQQNKKLTPFAYHDKGTMAIIGRSKAVAEIPKPKLFFKGFIAFVAWLFVHLISLINVRNKIKTLLNWTIAFFSKDQSMRVIVRPTIIKTEEHQNL
ncbi:NAD(P)/FAD-dependent oxidoreductase [Flavobacterium sp. DG1-102-2]|uniref:NAD(P)/FAD-dependent oxidoreductase n=1 Tax=Flavobacterium sp. DG1-102-2 TaxID=3081663 RepID=UPI002948E987|nr:NAD(P)/FAD-dependent oxidoreductase [Flavobacterium sp. DG1-102-2]MDV6169857.1 NAD(P)/FAD-dependent oxidoreductase [Flavobacterium sp. DG1-102-2]